MKLYVNYYNNCIINEFDAGTGDWDHEWHREYDFGIYGVNLDQNGESVDVDFEAKVGDTVYVLSMTYGTGDSFGNSSGEGEILWVFKDFDVAREAALKVREQQNEYSVVFSDENGNVHQLSNPGAGYFECVESVDITTCVVGEHKGRYSF